LRVPVVLRLRCFVFFGGKRNKRERGAKERRERKERERREREE
jgi:hypothetical protein